MGRARGGRVGGRWMSMLGGILRRRIESVDDYANVDQLVDHLRSTYPQYSRLPLLLFTKRVHQILHSSGKANDEVSDDSIGHRHREAIPRKKRKEFDENEVKLGKKKKKKKKNGVALNHCNNSDASSSGTAGSLEDCVTTSGGDGIDLMKSMLRENYCDMVKKSSVVEGNREVVVNQKSEDGSEFGEGNEGDGRGALNNYDYNGTKFKDLGGMSQLICQLIEELVVPFCRPEVTQHLGLEPIRGILLHGPPGCGKTKLAHAIANEAGVQFYKISATELVSGVSGASEENIRELFTKAYRTAPSIIFIDEIDVIASKKKNLERETDRRIVTQLMNCMDESYRMVKPVNGKEDSKSSNSIPGHVLVIGATNRPDAIDPALRRPGRFDYEFGLRVPDENARVEILRSLTRNIKFEGALDLEEVARSTPGFVGADLAFLVKVACIGAVKRLLRPKKDVISGEYCEDLWRQPWPREEVEKLRVTIADFKEAAIIVQPSTKREGFSTLPDVKWNEVGGLHLLKRELDRLIVKGIKHPEVFKNFGMDDVQSGILLYGPPGCGKTLIAKAVAREAGANFIHIKGPELLNKYVGESELALRTKFNRARTCSPCIIFFDEVDALTRNRGREGGANVEALVNQLLLELDGGEHRRGVYVIGATNRPEAIDPCLLRPGRFGNLLYVPLPSPEERGMILKALARKMKMIDASVDLMAIGKSCKNFSGADLYELMCEANRIAMDDIWASWDENSVDCSLYTVKNEHFKGAWEKISPSVSEEQIRHYERVTKSIKSGRRIVNASNTFIESFS